ncbi:MAG: family 20 glycosylhydrolase [Victivallaceae bacterium]|jgi:hypothetical protein
MQQQLLPLPKIRQISTGCYQGPDEIVSYDYFQAKRLADELNRPISGHRRFIPGNLPAAVLIIRKVASETLFPGLESAVQGEAYRLKISERQIEIAAVDERGAFYGIKTLKRLLACDAPVAAEVITDWPDLKLRGFHLNLGHAFNPVYSYIKQTIENLGELKINTLVLEYDGRFPWRRHAAVCDNSLTREELLSLLETARSNYIEVIPLVDSLGHAEQYLRHPQYAHLKEIPESIAEMCPSRSETMRFIQELWEEVLELHPDSRYAHISGDEVFRLGRFCPECVRHAADGTLAVLYLNYYRELSRWIIAHGKIPIIWGDMLIKYPEALESFPRDIVINDWCYNGQERNMKRPELFTNPAGICSEERQKLFSPYWNGPHGGRYHQYPYFRFFRDQGFKVLAGTAAGQGNWSPLSAGRSRFENNKNFALVAHANHGEGVLITFWHTNGPVAGAWCGIAAGADFSWHVREETYPVFMERFTASFLDLPSACADKLMQLDQSICHNGPPVTETLELSGPAASPAAADFMAMAQISAGLVSIYFRSRQLAEQRFRREVCGFSIPLDISAGANSTARNCLPPHVEHFELPSGEITAGGIDFLLPPEDQLSCIAIHAGTPAVSLPVSNENYDGIALLNFGYYLGTSQTAARMRIRYADGSECEMAFTAGINTNDWWGVRPLLKNGLSAWEGDTYEGSRIVLYLSYWHNPHPDREIAAISWIPEPGLGQGRLVIFAATGLRSGTIKSASEKPFAPQDVQQMEQQLDGIAAELKSIYSGWMTNEAIAAGAKHNTGPLRSNLDELISSYKNN